jgi:hypothetical protein
MTSLFGGDWVDVIKVVAGGGVFTAILTVGLNWFVARLTERTKLERDARYLAIRVAVVLERFALDCAEFIGDNRLHRESFMSAGHERVELPPLAAYPTDADWKAVPQDVLADCLSFPVEIEQSDRSIAFLWEVDPHEMPRACDKACAELGLRALEIAGSLRARYGFPTRKLLRSDYEVAASLQAECDRAERRRPTQRTQSEL